MTDQLAENGGGGGILTRLTAIEMAQVRMDTLLTGGGIPGQHGLLFAIDEKITNAQTTMELFTQTLPDLIDKRIAQANINRKGLALTTFQKWAGGALGIIVTTLVLTLLITLLNFQHVAAPPVTP
jgi:hypothetical protein